MANEKWSQWVDAGALDVTDKVPILRTGANVLAPLSAVRALGARELGYVERTTNFTTTVTTPAADVTDLALTVTVGDDPIMVHVQGAVQHSVTDKVVVLQLYDVTAGAVVRDAPQHCAFAAGSEEVSLHWRLNPAPGVRTYQVRAYLSGAGTGTLVGSATIPFTFQVTNLPT